MDAFNIASKEVTKVAVFFNIASISIDTVVALDSIESKPNVTVAATAVERIASILVIPVLPACNNASAERLVNASLFRKASKEEVVVRVGEIFGRLDKEVQV